MSSTSRPLLFDEERGTEAQGAWVASLRFLLRVINLILVVIGVTMVAYAVYMYHDVRQHSSLDGFPWFIFAFGAAGLFVVLTASSALVGVAHNSDFCLGLYSFLMVVLLIAQAALAIAFFADNSWKKLLPHDDTGEAKKMAKFLEHQLRIVRWVGLAALIVQVCSVLLAYALSGAQQKLLDEASDEDDEIWGRREALPRSSRGSDPRPADEPGRPQRTDAWSMRMRSKYGLDVDNFTYDPTRETQNEQAPVLPPPATPSSRTSRCSVM